MIYKILADIILVLHFFWIVFMLVGFIITFLNVFFIRNKSFFDWWFFRTLHLFGIVYVGCLAILGKYCPLTILENILYTKYANKLKYSESFIVHYIQKLVYPDVEPLTIVVPTVVVAIFTCVVFIIEPPVKIKNIF